MFTLYHSNQLDLLKELLVNHIRQAPLSHPFKREQILVQSPGMAQWLKLELAKAFGIAANIDFPLPASFIWEMFTQVLADVPRQSPYNKGSMSWQLMTILPTLLARPAFAPLAAYLGGAEGDEAEPEQVRLWQLCQQIADLFDQYLVYRPDWIARWEAGGGLVDGNSQELAAVQGQEWQPELWRELVARTLALSPSGYHRANLYEEFIHELQRTTALPGKLPERVFVFGISALPPRYVEALQALSERVDVHLFLANPCRHYWGDIRDRKTMAKLENRLKPGTTPETYDDTSINPLLASMGKLGRDYVHQLIDLPSFEFDAFSDITEDCLLRCIQGDVLDLRNRGAGQFDLDSSHHKSPVDPQDGSLQIHACHGPMRELEVLHDRLLALFEQDPTLTPKDVVVMMPDVNSYGPYIQAVFGKEKSGARGHIPFAVSDRAASQESPLLQSFLALLRLPNARFGAGELLAILEVPAVLRRFELDDDEFNQLRVWVQETGIRWGLDDGYPERFDLPRLSGNSWLFGLRRMLLGFAMGDGEPVAGIPPHGDDMGGQQGAISAILPYADDRGQQGAISAILPYAEIEGQQGLALGKLAWFVDSLAEFLPRLQQVQSLPEWSACLNGLLERFYLADEEEERLLQLIRTQLAEWQDKLGEARFEHPIGPSLLQDYLGNVLGEQRSSQRFLAGQVNFCTLMPMRSIPFRQVCLLGMNDGVYPRTLAPMGFDLMATASRRGDRSRRDDDRYLFLEALLSAQQGLYISYQGFSAEDNSEKVPSVLLAELIDYVRQGFRLAGDEALSDEASGERLLTHLVVEHPLTPYSHHYFYPKPGSGLFTYAADWLPALNPVPGAANFQSGELPLPPDWNRGGGKEQGLELAELLRFYRQPARYFLNRRLKVWFELNEANIEDSEPFELDGLQHYQLKSLLLASHLEEGNSTERSESVNKRRERLRLSGQLPQGWFGSLLLDDLDEQMGGLAERLRPWVASDEAEKQAVEIDISLIPGQLQGWIDTQKGRLLIIKPGSFNGKDMLLGWIQHLCLALSQAPGDTLLFDAKLSWRFPALSADEARPRLAALVALWQQGMKRPLPFFPNTAWDWLKAAEKDPDKPEAADKAALARFQGGWQLKGEGEDPYVARCFPALDEQVLSQLQALAREHLTPLHHSLEELK